MAFRSSIRPTGAWVYKNFNYCAFRTAPGFAEPTLLVRILAGAPRGSPTGNRKCFDSFVGEGLAPPADPPNGSLPAVGAAPCGRPFRRSAPCRARPPGRAALPVDGRPQRSPLHLGGFAPEGGRTMCAPTVFRRKRQRQIPTRRPSETNLSPTATKAFSKRGVPSPRLPPDQRQRKTRCRQPTERSAPLR